MFLRLCVLFYYILILITQYILYVSFRNTLRQKINLKTPSGITF